ncbi:MAG: hypothetical protein GWO16_07280 [Gammaproteobacteria bacterium]|nr:hypothetical protein [Gammaproteobacteria bacterium]NIR97770.1 hypothetical protein [Gammaproteobacteria bacterium]
MKWLNSSGLSAAEVRGLAEGFLAFFAVAADLDDLAALFFLAAAFFLAGAAFVLARAVFGLARAVFFFTAAFLALAVLEDRAVLEAFAVFFLA